jgi:hypothetical protein
MLKRGILAETPRIEGRNFYPLLAEVGKDVRYPAAWSRSEVQEPPEYKRSLK